MAGEQGRYTGPLVDCDVHNALPSDDALHPYMPADWRSRRDSLTYLPTAFRDVRENLGDRSYIGAEYPRPTKRASRVDAWPPGGGAPASDLAFTQAQLLDAWNISYAVLNPLLGIGEMLNLELAAVMARAANDWLADQWLDRDSRLRASIVVAHRRRRDRPGGARSALRAGAGVVADDRADGPPAVLADL
jgi:predicted TIM-barrel fold metal-dependent hydrolase